MLAMFFFLALYMQDILHYTPLQAGLRFLPSTALVMVVAPIAGRLADRVGPRPLMTIGLTLVSLALLWMTQITTHSGYGLLLVSFLLMGAGMGLVMSPMSTAAMNSVEQTKAGVASGILSMVRMVGGTFGVAVMGAIIDTLGRERLAMLLPQVSASERVRLVNALGSGASGSGMPAHIQTAMGQTYVYALSNALYVAGGLALLGALLAWLLVSPASRGVERSATAGHEALTPPEAATREATVTELTGAETLHV
jgi:MFS family permease